MGEKFSPQQREQWCFHHCRENLHKRYRLGLSLPEYRRLCRLLKDGLRSPIAYSWGNREILILWHGGKATKAVYDPHEALIVTFLPSHAYENNTDEQAWRRQEKKAKQRKPEKVLKNRRRSHSQQQNELRHFLRRLDEAE